MLRKKNFKSRNSVGLGLVLLSMFIGLPSRAEDTPKHAESDPEARTNALVMVSMEVDPPEPKATDPKEGAKELAPSPLFGEIPTKVKNVTLAANEESVAEILKTVSNQGGFGLVMDPAETAFEKRLTIQLKRKPFTEVLEIVLKAADLEGAFKGGILFVTAPKSHGQGSDADALRDAGVDSDERLNQRTRRRFKKTLKWHSGKQQKNRVQIGKSIHIKGDEVVDDAVAVGGSLRIDGTVRGDAVAVGGDLTVEPTGHVLGKAVSVGGDLNVKPGATVEGEQVSVGIPSPIGAILGEDDGCKLAIPIVLSGLAGTFAAFSVVRLLLQSLLMIVLALAVTALAPRRVEGIREYLSKRTGTSVLAGLLIFVAFVPFLILLAITLIGIPLIPVAIIALLVLMLFGQAAFLTWLGYKIPLFKTNKSQLGALALGALATFLISLIPVAGPLFLFGVGLTCAGSALLSRLGTAHVD